MHLLCHAYPLQDSIKTKISTMIAPAAAIAASRSTAARTWRWHPTMLAAVSMLATGHCLPSTPDW